MKRKIITYLLYILVVICLAIPFGGLVNTLISNNFKFVFSTEIFFGAKSFYIASIVAVVFLIIPLFYIGKRYITNNASTVDNIKKSKSNLHGSSRFLTDKELNKVFPLAELNNSNYNAGFIVKTEFKNNKLFGNLSYGRHCLLTGTTRTGKTTYLLEPTIQFIANSTNKPSLVITDPKGELFSKESGALEKKGYHIDKLDLRNPESSLRFNPLSTCYDKYQQQLNEFRKIKQHDEKLADYVEEHKDINTIFIDDLNTDYWFEYDGVAYEDLELVENAVESTRRQIISELKDDISQIASCIIPKEQKSEALWSEGSRALISSIIWGLLEDSEIRELNITKEKVTLNQISYILSSDEDYLMDFINNRPATSNAKNLGSQYSNNKAEAMRDSFKSMAITFLNKLNGLEYLLGDNEFDFTSFTSQPTAIFLIIPDESDSRYAVATMFISLLYSYLIKEASLTDNKLKREVFFLLDEFANLPPFEKIANWLSISGGRGILFFLIIQSLGQLNNIYGRDVVSTIQTQCQLGIYLGTSDKETQEYYQYLFGNETVRQTSVSAKPLVGEQTSNSENLTGKPLVRTDELGRIKRGEAYIKAFQEFPAKTTLVPIFYHTLTEYKGVKEEFLVAKSSAKMYKPKHFDLSALSYDIGERYKIFNPQAKKGAVNTKKEDIESELKELLEPVNETKKQAILEAFKSKKYNLVISNLKELKRSNEINSADELIDKIRNIKN